MRNLRKVRRPRTIYMKEIIMEDFGVVYASPNSKLDPTEILVRLKFRRRKWTGSISWDVDRGRMHMYASRRQRHKKMRFGWEYNCWYSLEKSLGNLRRVR